MSNNDQPEWLKTPDAVRLLGQSRRTLDRLVDEQEIRKKRQGKDALYHRGDIEIYKAKRRFQQTLDTPAYTEVEPYQGQDVRELREKLEAALVRIGYLQSQIDQVRPLLEDKQAIEQRLNEEQIKRAALEEQIAQREAQIIQREDQANRFRRERNIVFITFAILVALAIIVAMVYIFLR